LAVIDPDGGAQPMAAGQDGRTLAVITFRGEIYNFRELRAELESRGHRFRTRSDTEVLLRCYLQWGSGFAERLNGMFAAGIWDPASEELLLARDRMGVTPHMFDYLSPGPCPRRWPGRSARRVRSPWCPTAARPAWIRSGTRRR